MQCLGSAPGRDIREILLEGQREVMVKRWPFVPLQTTCPVTLVSGQGSGSRYPIRQGASV